MESGKADWHLAQIEKNTQAAKDWLELIGWTVTLTLPVATLILFLDSCGIGKG